MYENIAPKTEPGCTCLQSFVAMRADGRHYWSCPLSDPLGDLLDARDRARAEYRLHGSRNT